MLECDYVIQLAVKVLKRVHVGELPFDRTVQVSVTDRLEKDQILGRFPHNLRTIEILLKQNRDDYRIGHVQKAQDVRSAARPGDAWAAAAVARSSWSRSSGCGPSGSSR